MMEFIYFDVGGVLIHDFSCTGKWEELRESLGVKKEDHERYEKIWETYAGSICTETDCKLVLQQLREDLNLTVPTNFDLLEAFVDRFERTSESGHW